MANDPRYKDWEFAWEAHRTIVREWAYDLSHMELHAALFVFDRTVGWGKEWETITRQQAACGIWDKCTGEIYAAPITGCGKGAVECLTKLVEAGVLKTRKAGKLNQYSLNLDDMKVGKKRKVDPETGRIEPRGIPNSAQRAVEAAEIMGLSRGKVPTSGRGKVPTLSRGEVPTKEQQKNKSSKREELPAAAAPCGGPVASFQGGDPEGDDRGLENLPSRKIVSYAKGSLAEADAATQRAIERSRCAREARKLKGDFARSCNGKDSGFVPYMKAFPAIWRDLTEANAPEVPASPVTEKAFAILRQYGKSWTAARKEGEFMEYLDWVFDNWRTLGAGVFDWMKDFPPTPTIPILTNAKIRHYIEDAYKQKEWWARWRKMDECERRVLHLVTNKGMDRDKAEQVARREHGYREDMKALKDEQRKVEIMRHNAKTAIEAERAAFARQVKKGGLEKKPFVMTEGSFGKWEEIA